MINHSRMLQWFFALARIFVTTCPHFFITCNILLLVESSIYLGHVLNSYPGIPCLVLLGVMKDSPLGVFAILDFCIMSIRKKGR